MINRLLKGKSRKASAKSRKPVAKAPPALPPRLSIAPQLEQLQSNDWKARSVAALELGRLGNCEAASSLIAALRDQTAEVARDAAIALGALQDVSASAALKAVVLNADGYFHNTVRIAAADALVKLRDPGAIDALLAGVHDQWAEVSQAAIRSLGLLGQERAIDSLEKVVRNQDGFFLLSVRQAAVEALGRLSIPRAREVLRGLAADTYLDCDIRQAATAELAAAHSAN